MNELQVLALLSHYLGQDKTLIQGAGGNTSFKSKDILWVKASGCLLSSALDRNIFVELYLPELQAKLLAGETVDCRNYLVDQETVLRPSMETAFHALLKAPFVMHVHSINSIIHSTHRNGYDNVASLLNGLNWAWIPYIEPGLPLSATILESGKLDAEVFILANHGVIVAGESAKRVLSVLVEVESRLWVKPNSPMIPDLSDLAYLAKGSEYRLPKEFAIHQLAWGKDMAYFLSQSFYPDHVVFLKNHIGIAANPKQSTQKLLVFPGVGVLVHKTASLVSEEMMLALALFWERVSDITEYTALTAIQEKTLLSSGQEKYRQEVS